MTRNDVLIEITPQVLLKAYACGIFPMAESAQDPAIYWVEPELRGIIPLDRVHIPRSLAKTVRSECYEIRYDSDFQGVIDGCAAPGDGRRKTWINDRIRMLYGELHEIGYCHTVEAWKDDKLVGGLYGVRLGCAFFGESMFHTERDASKVALIHLIARLRKGGFTLLDTQFVTEHLRTFGAVEVDRKRYHSLLEAALDGFGTFDQLSADVSPDFILQSVSQTS